MRPVLPLWLLVAFATGGAAQRRSADPDSVRIVTSDIDNFWRAYDRLTRQSTHDDSVRAFAEEYFKPASPGLAEFIRLRIGSPDSLVGALGQLPRYYAAIRPNTLRIHQMTPMIRDGLRRFQALYPGAAFPDVYFLVGRFTTMGTASDRGLYIGAEMVSSDSSTLGYWMGYQVARAYYERAPDKRQAAYDLLHIRDYDALLEASGYAKRMER